MNISYLKLAWLSGWRIVARLFLLLLATLLFLIPLNIVGDILPKTVWRGWAVIVGIFNFLVMLPIGTYYAAKWCKEFKDERE